MRRMNMIMPEEKVLLKQTIVQTMTQMQLNLDLIPLLTIAVMMQEEDNLLMK